MLEKYNKYRNIEEQIIVAGKFFAELYRQTLNKTGMSKEIDFSVLELKGMSAFIDMNSEYSVSELSRNAHLPLPNMTFIINGFEKKGIAKRYKSTKDKRVVYVRLTPKGKKLFRRFIEKRMEEFENTFGRLSEQDRQALVNALKKATEIFHKLNNQ